MTSSARETLEQCSLKLQVVSESIDRIRKLSNSNSSSPTKLIAPPPTPTSPPESSANMPPKRAAARCHECHGPISGYHQGYPHGLGTCQLEHYDFCNGGVLERDRGGHSWTPCPEDYVPPEANGQDDDHGTDFGKGADLDYDSADSQASKQDCNSENFSSFPPFDKTGTRSCKEDDGIRVNAGRDSVPRNKSSTASKSVPPPGLPAQTTDVDLLLQAELAELAIAEDREKKLKEIADIKRRRDQTQQNIERLSRQAQGEGARKKETIHENIDMLRTANQPQRESRRGESGYRGPTIEEIRRDGFTREQVEPMMEHVYTIPSFSNAAQPRQGQPRLKKTNHQTTSAPTIGSGQGEESTSTLYKWVMKRDQYGEEYKELVEVPRSKSPARPRLVVDAGPGWQYDEYSNRMYRVQPPTHNSVPRNGSNQHHGFADSVRVGSTPVRMRADVVHSPVRQRIDTSERFPGIVPLSSQPPAEDREGKLPMSIASHARNMPLEYARSATSKNMNFAVFMYGAIHELHSSRIGITPPMPRGILEAKLQHLMNVIHVTCLNASATDFKPIAWSVGRTYHSLVQSKVDSGREGWNDFDLLHRGSPHAAEMIAAEREHRAALLKKPEKIEVRKKEDKKDEKPPCPSWNDYEEEGKCKWEADHPGDKCNRSHHCSFCKKKNPALRTLHQARFCKRKLEEDR